MIHENRVTLNGDKIQSKDYKTTLEIFENPDRITEILNRYLEKQPQVTSLEDFPSPYEMKGMKEAVDVFTEVVASNGKIKLVIDSDMDGLSCYNIWYKFFTYFPYTNIEMIITDRKQGYGMIPDHIDNNTALYITSDNGITAVPATKYAKDKGAKVIICDHHQTDPELGLPPADAIVDPHQVGCPFPYKDISGSFVLWFFIKALTEKYSLNINIYDEFLPEIALTTLSDVMPLNKHLNRFVVTDFVNKFPGINHREYLNTFRKEVNDSPTAEDFSFGLTPMINATQRITKADHGAQFLIADNPEKSLEWFNFIKGINDARKERQQTLLTYIEKHFKDYIDAPFIIIPGHFHKEFKGVLGIIAGRLADTCQKPTIVMNFNEGDQSYSGSGRSTGELNILDLLRKNNYVKNVGGHRQALGITVTKDNFDNFYTSLMEDTKQIPDSILKPVTLPLGFIPINKINIDFFDTINKMEPFGHKFQKPAFVTKAILKSAHLVGKQKNHLTLVISDKKGMVKFKGMKFFTTSVPEKGAEYMVYFKFGIDKFRGTGDIQLMVTNLVKIKTKEDLEIDEIFPA